MVNKIRG